MHSQPLLQASGIWPVARKNKGDELMEKRMPLVILTGPTAAGKTELSLSLAKKIGGEIISADSMQIYKKMNIGTAKILPEQMQGIRHYLVDELMPDEEFNVVIFQKMAKAAMEDIISRGKIPIIVGGTGFYIQALLNDIDFTENDSDMAFRRKLEDLAGRLGALELHKMLAKVDPQSAEKIHANNVKRVIRALEFYEKTGEKISMHNDTQRQKQTPYNSAYFVLTWPREILYDRINKRVDTMLRDGLVDEVKGLLSEGYGSGLVSMQGLGYKEFVPYLSGEIALDEAVYILKRDTRHFAKRQLTWFRRERDVLWLDKSEFENEEAILYHILEILKERGIYHG